MSQTPTIQETSFGALRGTVDEGLQLFLGVRYAAAPVGALRFRPPQPYEVQEPIVDATRFGHRNYQVGVPEEVFADLEPQGDESEDCLFLNIYAPESRAAPKPVLVWIHGGAFMCGSGNDYDASTLARDNDVVVVTINYRLGIFGFLNLQGLGPEFSGSANLGIQDQIAALRWIKDHIADFGGDSSNITIFGESAGAASVLALFGAPAAEDLFHKGIAFSGAETLAPPMDHLTQICASRGFASHDECLKHLQAMPAEELTLLQQETGIYVGPSIDGAVLTRPACEAIRDGGAAGIPFLSGATRDEGTILAEPFAATEEMGQLMVFALAASVGRDDGTAYRAFLQQTVGDKPVVDYVDRAWFDIFRASALRVAATASQHGAGGWVYNFELDTDHPLGVAHFADVPFTFNWIEEGNERLYVHRPTASNRTLARQWSRTICEFARNGSPNGQGLPDWPQYAPDRYECLWFSETPEVVSNPDGDEMLALYRVPT